jgi:voltage-gated potassium channel
VYTPVPLAQRLVRAAIVSAVVVAVGTVGFILLTDEGVIDAFYRTMITVTTIGLATVPESTGAKLFTAFLSVAGVAIFLYVFGLITEVAVGGALTGAVAERRSRRHVDTLEGHYVICGYGRMGRSIAQELDAAGTRLVVVDMDPNRVEEARRGGHLALVGSGSDDETLERAGIHRARGLVACAGSDAENLYIVVNAHELEADLVIVARASDEDAAKNLMRGGAHRTVSPFAIAGREIAAMLAQPEVAAYFEFPAGSRPGIRLAEIEVPPDCLGCGMRIDELAAAAGPGAAVVAHRRAGGDFTTRLDPGLRLEAGDVLIGIGTPAEVGALEDLFRPREALAS